MRVSRYVTHSIRRHTFARAAAFMLVTCVCFALLHAGAAEGAGSAGDRPETALGLDDAIALALAASPEVAAAERALELARMRLLAAEALRRPTVTLRALPAQISRAPNTASSVAVSPLPGPEPEGTRFLSTLGLDVHLPIGETRITLSIDGTYLRGASAEPDTDLAWSLSGLCPILGPVASLAGAGDAGVAAGRGSGGSIDAQVRAAMAAVRNASFALEQAREKARAALEEAYYAVLRDRRKLEAAEMNLERVKQHLAITEARFEHGNASSLDVLDARERVAAAKAALDAARHAVTLSDMNFNRVIGRDLAAPVSLAPVGDYVPGILPRLEACVKEALQRRREPALAQAELRDQEAELASAREGLLPSVSLVGSAKDDGSWNIGIQVTKTLTPDLDAEAAVKAAEDAVASAREKLEATRTAIVLEVTQAYYALVEAETALSLARSGLERARLALDTAQEQYRLGGATHQDVAAAIAGVHDAEVEVAGAVAGCFMARSRLARAMGMEEHE